MYAPNGYHCGAWALTYLLILLFAVEFCSGVNDCSSHVEPMIQYVPLGNVSKNFTCHGSIVHHEQHWIIDGNTVLQCTGTCHNLRQRGFSFFWMINISMTIDATMINNDTEIKCKVVGSVSCGSKVASRFIVIGAPSPPELHWEAVNATWILLSWNVPFTWTNYSILQYNITITNTSTGEGQEVTINAMESDDKVKYYTSIEMIAQSCIKLIFNVSASNALGWSEPGMTTGGFPIRTPGSFISSVKAEVYFKSDGTPIANITFELPHMCIYQTLKYTIVICNITDESNIPFDVGPKEYLYSQGSSISEILESQLVRNAVYSILAVTVQTAAGNSTSNDSATFNTTVTLKQTTDQRLTVIIAAAVVSTAVVLFLVIASIAIAKAVVRTRKHKQGGETQSARVIQSAMVPNPIYEGPMYETVVPQNFDSLATNVESETPESRYLDTPILPARSGETNARIGPVTNNASTAGGTEDNYTVMSPIGSHSILSLNKDAENY